MGRLYKPCPTSPFPGAKVKRDPAADPILAKINTTISAITRAETAENEARDRGIELKSDLESLYRAARAIGLHLETDADSGIVRLAPAPLPDQLNPATVEAPIPK